MSELDRLRIVLADLEVEPEVLRRDPTGRTWLPPELRAAVASDERCTALVRAFVDAELDLFRADPAPDPFFTAAVLRRLPPPSPGLRPEVRLSILAAFQAVAMGCAYLTLTVFAPEEIHQLVDTAEGWVGAATSVPIETAAAAMMAVVGAGALMILGVRLGGRTPVT